ncbi:hypothetical protein TNCV_294941 [Trichonephila clavipes]|nr:hypothetical protein TNCV_294941 [Trichonephila clavipes]
MATPSSSFTPASLGHEDNLEAIKLRSAYLQGKSTAVSVIARQMRKDGYQKREKQRMAQTHAEGAAEQHTARLENAHLGAHNSSFETSDLLCSQQKGHNRWQIAERCQPEKAHLHQT